MSANKKVTPARKPGRTSIKTYKQPPFASAACFIAKYLFRPLRRLTEGMEREHAYVYLRGILLKVMADKNGRPGQIDVLQGKLRLLNGFEFNRANTVVQPFLKKCRSWVDENNRGIVMLPNIHVGKDIIAPPGAAYFRICSFMISLDHKMESYQVKLGNAMGLHLLGNHMLCGAYWAMPKKMSGKALLVTGFGIRFYDKQVQEIVVEEYVYDSRGGKHPAANTVASSLVINKALPW